MFSLLLCQKEPMVEFRAAFHIPAKAQEDPELLYNAGEGKWGIDENAFIKILLSSPPRHLKQIEVAYTTKHERGLEHAIDNEFSSSDAAALKFFGAFMT
jgi:hypothetical protein